MEGFTKCEEAKVAHEAQVMLGHLTVHEFMWMVRSNMIKNCNVTNTAI